ncbi:MAG: magnesium transporter CorA family protein, partial [Vicinamibacteraceae bacterium]|nr:magnesium transporter CorA family protein [Vicinamibacteraceae bacterium]
MITVFVHQAGHTRRETRVDPAWLEASSDAIVWVDLAQPTPDETRILTEVFHFHELAIEDALATTHDPKIDSYGDYLFLILHGIDVEQSRRGFGTRDVDFFVGRNYVVTVHGATSRSMRRAHEACARNGHFMSEGPMALVHRIVDGMVDNYRPEVDMLEKHIDALEEEAFSEPASDFTKRVLRLKKDISYLRRIVQPQRDAVGRLARREFESVSEAMAYRFRDVHDHLVRISDEAVAMQDRLSVMLDGYLSFISNRLNEVMKVLAALAIVFGPLTVVTGLMGMNV